MSRPPVRLVAPAWLPLSLALVLNACAPPSTSPPTPDVHATVSAQVQATLEAAPAIQPTPTVVPLAQATRAEVLAAVDRANQAWTKAKWTLNPDVLRADLAGSELDEATAYVDQSRRDGRKRRSIMSAFEVTGVEMVNPVRVLVRTRETWNQDVYQTGSGRLVQKEPAKTYTEEYTVEQVNGRWVVTRIQL